MHKIKSVKLWMAVILIACVGFLTYVGQVTGEQYIDFIKWALGIYTAGNVGTKISRGVGNGSS